MSAAAVPVGRAVRVTVPASTANLGSGFDALGMALGLHDVVQVETTRKDVAVEVVGQGAGRVPRDARHLVVRAVHAAWEALGVRPTGLALRCENAIPHSRGLGSSAAAAVAGVAAGFALAGADLADPVHAERALQVAAELEGHADNAAASLLGGVVVAWAEGAEYRPAYRAVRLESHPELAPVVLVPEEESSTATTRGLLPDQVPHGDAAFAAGRAALAVHALTSRPDLLLPATADRLHQDYREPAWPATARLVRALRAAGVPAAVSGAGPTVLAFPTGGALPPTVDTTGFTPRALPVDLRGVRVEDLG
ncbi:homoserine kinase [Streptoalloteichus tenebrarius]|uniref:Homoserine kinase n=1 Tax=Streptoalloteichus tenebrarius (strain ATCC 17920 / DSM 40477 / JCM 4838 / CBS 697.72 / NBRC 16177 / NCIMB 11028 / NRRL B-12390 / A12253. 1 / ISP 5477) TaxID=1933 RepID=A0ABT1HXP3_STRSD|nr:homoserine kinase [Streptoalloteichus tenebrarius]MCP2260282.1 homoserine kinase [Streptoalloteichus tenebrarius]BFF03032.1 homoserine kinase [Streptoalloteichus tenebrarius]